MRLSSVPLHGFAAVHHVGPPASLLLLLAPLQRLDEVVGAVSADEARLQEGRQDRGGTGVQQGGTCDCKRV